MRAKEKAVGEESRWRFGLIAEVTERTWIVWVLKRMREAVEEKVQSLLLIGAQPLKLIPISQNSGPSFKQE